MAEVRELLAEAAAAVEEPATVPVGAVLAAGRRRVRRGRWAVAGAGAAVVAVALAVLPLRTAGESRAPVGDGVAGMVAGDPVPRVDPGCAIGAAELSRLPRRPVDPARDDFPTDRAADLLALHGWPRAVPYDVARWTVATRGDVGLLLVDVPGRDRRYLPITRDAGRNWVAGPPCTPR